VVRNEAEFDAALTEAWNDRTQLHLIHAKLVENDASRTLRRLADRLGQRV
jgi:indolepyruvate decarboxylase